MASNLCSYPLLFRAEATSRVAAYSSTTAQRVLSRRPRDGARSCCGLRTPRARKMAPISRRQAMIEHAMRPRVLLSFRPDGNAGLDGAVEGKRHEEGWYSVVRAPSEDVLTICGAQAGAHAVGAAGASPGRRRSVLCARCFVLGARCLVL